tara:strand:- start:632 stop:805 length:174 start_codon:yes stop_codon:yes gene_type:complete
MEDKYSIEEILNAVDDLQNLKKNENLKNLRKKKIISENLDIPKNTIKLIEEAEKSKN